MRYTLISLTGRTECPQKRRPIRSRICRYRRRRDKTRHCRLPRRGWHSNSRRTSQCSGPMPRTSNLEREEIYYCHWDRLPIDPILRFEWSIQKNIRQSILRFLPLSAFELLVRAQMWQRHIRDYRLCKTRFYRKSYYYS